MTSRPKSQENVCRSRSLAPTEISYQVNEAVEVDDANIKEKVNLDWKRLTNNALVNRLSGEESAGHASGEGEDSEKAASHDDDEDSRSCKKAGSKSSCQSPEEKLSESDEQAPEPPIRRAERRPRKGKKEEGSDAGGADKILKKKLNEVLQEGILDSVLPYLLPKQEQQFNVLQPPIKKLLLSNDIKKSGHPEKNDKNGYGNGSKEKKDSRRRSVTSTDSEKPGKSDKKDVEVVIHVCDEIKNLKKDFRCSQKLLISEMGYFAEVTNGQKLEDMDISVHCDVAIFDWLMKWVQKDSAYEDSWPRLDPAIVVPVLLSSAFLQMDTLQEHCLRYCKHNINEILRDSSSLTCVNDSILTRLASMFSNTEVENLKDKKDKLQSRLYCKLIVALTEPQPQPQRGHYSTVATMYRCSRCSKLILRSISSSILCVPGCMTMDRSGFIVSTHVRDPNWNLTDYVKALKSDLKQWKKVYWRLWSDCHLLFCHTCSSYFPVHQMHWCRYHPESAQFFVKDNQRTLGFPLGRYPCCGERAYRFEILKNKLGCQYREHSTDPKSQTEMEIYRLWSEHKDLIRAEPPQIIVSERVRHFSKADGGERRSPVRDSFWWDGLQLVPPTPRTGLFAVVWDKIIKKDDARARPGSMESRSPSTKKNPPSRGLESSSTSESSDQQSSASDAGDSEDSGPKALRVTAKAKAVPTQSQSVAAARLSCLKKEKRRRKMKRKGSKGSCKNEGSQFWVPKLSTRCNQDNQREFEERAFRQMETILIKKISGDVSSASRANPTPPGGIYVKLEQEWREAHCNVHGCPASSVKAKGSSSAHGSTISSGNASSGRSRTRSHRL